MYFFSENTELILVIIFSEMHFEFLHSANHECIKLKTDFIVFQSNFFFKIISPQYVKKGLILINNTHIQFVRQKDQRAFFGQLLNVV
jgi:hypothetical protein